MKGGWSILKKGRWSLKEQGEFLRRVGELIVRGYPLKEALSSLTLYLNEWQKKQLIEGINDLKAGYPFYYVLRKMNFHDLLISFVYFGEQHGALAETFFEGSKFILRRYDERKKLQKILFYPFLLIFVTIILFISVDSILLPQFHQLLMTMNVKENIFLQLILFISDTFPIFLSLIIGVILIFSIYYHRIFKQYQPLRRSMLISRLPIIGPFYKLYRTYYFSIHFSHLLNSGLSVMEGLQIFKNHQKNDFDQDLGHSMYNDLMEGRDLPSMIEKYPFFEEELPFIIKHGQENGKLGEELSFYSTYLLSTLEGKMERAMKIIQPTLYLLIGFMIVSMYLAILLPMFQILESI